MRRLALVIVLGLAVAAPATAAGSPCDARIDTGVVPVWARAGFSDPKPRIAHVLGARRDIVAILFGYPLLSPPSKLRNNKILWVSRRKLTPLSDLRIRAQRMVGSRAAGQPVVRMIAGGPGPSIVDLPAPGCWRLTLRWSGYTDTLDLAYRRNG